ncbi:MAG: tetratricopeptide repeat protein [Bacteroidetes bacterium]|nr:tetratricopeptide repeat protein [Bacteroidota bacterium]MBL6944072.1 tetratricopeptide repeat protein [Bacteroidales bacterium]
MIKIVTTLIISTILFNSCGNYQNNKSDNGSVSIDDINKLEEELFSGEITTPDLTKAKQLAEFYLEYAELYPDDTLSPEFLFKAADISMNVNNPKLTISLFNKILSSYPDYEDVSIVMFLKGFVYEDQLNDYANAKKCYLEFLDKFPESDFADDAVISLKNLGKSPEELIKEFELKNDSNR